MQNKYVGDIGDYGKYALLKSIASMKYRVGINWYLMNDENNNDGNHIKYLFENKYRECDPILFDMLKEIVINDKRSVKSIEKSHLLGENCVFYSKEITIPSNPDSIERIKYRNNWHLNAMRLFQDCDIVFLDPDNGLEVKSVVPYSAGAKNGGKYVAINELIDYYLSGKTVITYNHRDRSSKEKYYSKFVEICDMNGIDKAKVFIMNYNRGTSRDYIVFAQDRHIAEIKKQCYLFLQTKWSEHFKLIDL